MQVTKNVGDPDYQSGIFSVVIYETDEEGERVEDENGNPIIKENIMQNYSYLYVPASSKVNTYIGFNVPNNFSGKYDIYVITMPIWFYKMEAEVKSKKTISQLLSLQESVLYNIRDTNANQNY